ncbi:MAG: caspase family protein [Geobacteraceae bacterium]|nr:caspase family protein [Geobacteraceae bacterium]
MLRQTSILLIGMVQLCLIVMNVYALEPSTDPVLRIETGGHVGRIDAAASDRLGRIVATVSVDKTVRVWETGTGRLLKTLRVPIGDEHEGMLNSVALSPDGSLIATGGNTGKSWQDSYVVYLFELATGRMVKRVAGSSMVIRDIRFSRDGKQLIVAAGGKIGEVAVINLADATVLGRHSFSSPVEGIDLSSVDKMAVITRDGVLHLYQSSLDQNPRKFELTDGSVPASCRFNPRGDRIAIGFSAVPRIQLVELADFSGRVLTPAARMKKDLGLSSVAWSMDGTYLYAAGQPGAGGGKGKRVFIWDDGGAGAVSNFIIPAQNQVISMLSTQHGNLFFALNLWGILETDRHGELRYQKKMEKAAYQYNHDLFATSADGAVVRFSYSPYGQDVAAFDIASRFFVKGRKTDVNELVSLPTRTTEFIDLQNWNGFGVKHVIPKLNRKPLKIFENIRNNPLSFGIAPDGESFFIGASGAILKFDKRGRLIWRMPVAAGALSLALSKDGRFLITGMTDGTIRWYLQSDGTEQLALFPHPDQQRWVAWIPEGYFDASPGSSELIGYHINQGKDTEAKFVPMSNLYDVFYRPDIIQARFKGEDIKELVTLTAEEALKSPPPEIRFTTVPSTTADVMAKLCYQVKSVGGGIGELRLFQNGKLIKSDGYYRESVKKEKVNHLQLAQVNSRSLYTDLRSLAIKEKKPSGAAVTRDKGDLVDECVELETISGENEIGLVAFNARNTVQSFLQTTTFLSTRVADEPHLYILAVGIDRYRDSGINLKYAAKDARDFINSLPEKARTLYKPQHIHLITLSNGQAGKQNILKTINELATKVKHGDGFIFFNASHGVLLQNQYYIVTADYNGSLDNTDSLISSNEIVEISKKIKSLSQLFIFDTCHAGGVDNIVSGLYDARMSVLAKKMGLHIYASAGSVQTAMDGYKGNGLYTYALLQGIENGGEVDRGKDGNVTVQDLGLYSQEKTSELSAKLGHPQTPLIINFGRDNPLFVVR